MFFFNADEIKNKVNQKFDNRSGYALSYHSSIPDNWSPPKMNKYILTTMLALIIVGSGLESLFSILYDIDMLVSVL
jgi:hypothetical protein